MSQVVARPWIALVLAVVAADAVAQLSVQPTVTARTITSGLHVLYGAGGGQIPGNVLVSIGEQGAMLVDTGFPVYVPRYRAAIAELGGRDEIAVVINTHWHDDHAEGNTALGGALIVAHTSSRVMMARDNTINVVRTVLNQSAYPVAALPVITYDDRIELYFNGERIDLLHVSPAHTTGDTVVFFRGRNTVHMGDVFLSSAYPFFDVDNGGDFDGLIAFCRRVLDEIERDTIVVPGHGEIASYGDLAAYVVMLETVRERVAALIADGASLAQVIAAQPTAEWDGAYGNPTTYFLDRAYASLTRQ